MNPIPSEHRPSPTRYFAVLLFVVLVSGFTWKLLHPQPVPETLRRDLHALSSLLPFFLAKATHILGYATLTAVGGWAFTGRRARILLVTLLVLHAAGTEIGQRFVPNRTGKAADVLLDCVGIALGICVVRRVRPDDNA